MFKNMPVHDVRKGSLEKLYKKIYMQKNIINIKKYT